MLRGATTRGILSDESGLLHVIRNGLNPSTVGFFVEEYAVNIALKSGLPAHPVSLQPNEVIYFNTNADLVQKLKYSAVREECVLLRPTRWNYPSIDFFILRGSASAIAVAGSSLSSEGSATPPSNANKPAPKGKASAAGDGVGDSKDHCASSDSKNSTRTVTAVQVTLGSIKSHEHSRDEFFARSYEWRSQSEVVDLNLQYEFVWIVSDKEHRPSQIRTWERKNLRSGKAVSSVVKFPESCVKVSDLSLELSRALNWYLAKAAGTCPL